MSGNRPNCPYTPEVSTTPVDPEREAEQLESQMKDEQDVRQSAGDAV